MLRSLSVAAFALSAAGVGTTPVAAQETGCEDAAARIGAASLPRAGAPEWNDWVSLTGCGSRGATVIAGVLRSDGVRRETELSRLDYLAGILDGWFQPQLVAAYESLLRAPDASYGVRLRAMWLLAGLYAPDVEVAGPLQGYMTARCERYDRSTSLRDAPATLPAAAYDQARSAIAFAVDDRGAPEYVRSTARCWEDVIVDELQNGTRSANDNPNDVIVENASRTVVVEQPRTVYVERPVRVVYECGNRFMLYNDAGYDLAVRYDGYGRRGVLRVAHGGPYVWTAARFGPVRFWVGDREVWYSDAVYRPCGGVRVVVAPSVHIWTGWHSGLGLYIGNRGFGVSMGRPVIVRPRYVPPRVTRPIVIVNPRGNRPGGNRNQPVRDNRNNRDNRANRDGRDNRDTRAIGVTGNVPRGNPGGPARPRTGGTVGGGDRTGGDRTGNGDRPGGVNGGRGGRAGGGSRLQPPRVAVPRTIDPRPSGRVKAAPPPTVRVTAPSRAGPSIAERAAKARGGGRPEKK